MHGRLEAWIGGALARWVAIVASRPGAVLLATAAATAGAATLVVSQLGVNANPEAMFSDDLPHRAAEIEFYRAFPMLHENVLIVLDGGDPDSVRRAAGALADRLRAHPNAFRDVYLPRDSFLDERALLYLEVEALEDLADRVARFAPYLSSLVADGTLRGFARLLARGVRAADDADPKTADLDLVLERVAGVLAARRASADAELSWSEFVAGRALEREQRLLLVQPVLDFQDLTAARTAMETIRSEAEALGPGTDLRVRVTGDMALAFEEMSLVRRQAATAGVASLVLVGAILGFGLRSIRLVAATLVSLGVGLVWTAAFAAVAIGHLSIISVAFAVLFIGLAVDFGIHTCLRYRERLEAGLPHGAALEDAARDVGSSLVLCAITTAVGFYAFVPTDYDGVAELGLISGTGMFASLFCSLTVLPAVLSSGRPSHWVAPNRGRRPRVDGLPTLPLRHPRRVLVVAFAAGVGALATLPYVAFDQNPLRVRDPAAESVQTFGDLVRSSEVNPWSLNALARDAESAERLARELDRLEAVGRTVTLRDYVPKDQAAKLEILRDAALFLPETAQAVARPEVPAEEQLAALRELAAALAETSGSGAAERTRWDSLRGELDAWLAAFATGDQGAEEIAALERALLGTLPAALERWGRALAPDPVALDRLPEGLVRRSLAPDGRVRVRILPSEDLSRDAALVAFVTAVRDVAPAAAGTAIGIYEARRAVVRALQQAFAAAALVIGVLLLLIWRNWADPLFVLVPLGLAALGTAAVSVLAQVPFNFANVIVLPLLLGIGVDSGIHLVHRARISGVGDPNLLETSTARAVVLSALTTVASFGSLAFASHRGMASLGQLLAVGVALTIVSNLVVLPALVALRQRRSEAARG
ncbi:MAG: MMPL family transporter [Proteobacteria bacterium]|nr:MMPL family transporter [Pseudomonadota bacterium]